MASSARTVPPPPNQPGVDTAAIVAMVGKGMTAREILRLFPELTSDDIRGALLRAAEVVRDEDASLLGAKSGLTIAAEAREASGLSDEEAMSLAVEETRAARRERARQK